MPNLTADQARKLLSYNSESGVLRWNIATSKKIWIGQIAGSNAGKGYRQIRIFGQLYREHRVIWLIYYGKWPNGEIDHINGKRSDNRICNLREATDSQQLANAGLRKNKSSKFKGVSWHKTGKKWQVFVKREYLGLFDTEQEAHAAYCHRAKEAFGEFARLR